MSDDGGGVVEGDGSGCWRPRDPLADLSLSCLEPLHATDITDVILGGIFFIGHPK